MIGGVVQDDSGVAVEGARVYFVDAPVAMPEVAALTGPDGRFSLGAPVAGSYTVECRADGFTVARITVHTGEARSLTLTLRPG